MTKQVKAIIISIVLIIVGILTAGGIYHREVIKKWFKETFPTKQTVDKLKKENAEKTEQLSEKDNEIKNLQTSLNITKTALTKVESSLKETETKLTTATSERTTLLSAVTEIDNKINAATDKTEISNLTEKKTAILSQIDTLNSNIKTLTADKTKLQNQVTQLTAEKTTLQQQLDDVTVVKTEFLSSYYSVADMIIPETNFKRQVWTFDNANINVLRDFCESPECNIDLCQYLNVTYGESTYRWNFHYSTLSLVPVSYSIRGTGASYDDALTLLNNASLYSSKINVKCLLTYVDDQYSLTIDLLDKLFEGNYVADNGDYVNFLTDGKIELKSGSYNYSGLLFINSGFYDSGVDYIHRYNLTGAKNEVLGVIEFIDENSFVFNGVTYSKQESQSSLALGIGSFDLTNTLSGSGTVLNTSGTNFNYFQLNFSEIELDTNARYLFELLDSAGDVLYTCQSVLTGVSTKTVQGYSIDAINGDKNEGLNFAITYECQMDADNNPVASDNSYIYFIIAEGYEEAYKNVATLRITEISQSE